MPAALALLIVAQSKHETQNYTSPVFLDCNNAFGFGYMVNTCSTHNYKGYSSVIDNTYDITSWINQNFSAADIASATTPAAYAQLLSNYNYYTDTVANYTAGLQQYYTTTIPGAGTGGSGSEVIPYNYGILIVGIVAFLLFRKQIFKS